MKRFLIITTTVCLSLNLLTTVAFGQGVKEIVEKHEKQKVADLEKYLSDNPEAEDLDAAYFFLANALTAVGDTEKIPTILEKRYALQPKGANAPVQLILSEILQPYIVVTSESGQKDKAKAFIETIKNDLRLHPASQRINQILDQVAGPLNLPGVGETMEISFTSTEGEEIDLAKMKGKVVLVDFWATWCGPCIQEMPNVIAAYEKYKDQGFEVIGISLDQDESKLKSFISDKNMTWPQYFDGKGWKNEIASKLGIKGIPATFLIGKDGKIAASNLRGNALDKAVEAALK